ncbi:calcineurin-binding protein cabin-1-like [Clavelina lepadiformis]|uniref:calcineurin-binding protein cabin-1-like n=1 Tax=Clavelina lepadiformis TaxID=159417 RepID=UPI004041857A
MFRLTALNEHTSEESSNEEQPTRGTKEAQEARAFDLYNDALQLQRDQRHNEAICVYEDLLQTSLVTHAATTLIDENGEAKQRPLKDPGLILKYSTHKNMASMAAERGDINTAMEHYLEAVMLDTTDVTLWQRIGTHAITLGRLALARHAFTSGLSCNENHWPCLDSAITVLYALLDYESCLYWISKGLEKDSEYLKGLVLREKMYEECPHLRRDSEALFRRCPLSINDAEINEEEASDIISEALQLRQRHRKLCVPKPAQEYVIPTMKLSWLDLGESLVAAYDVIMKNKDVSFASPIRFSNKKNMETPLKQQVEQEKYAQEVSSPSRSGFDVKVRDVVADDVISATVEVTLNRDADIVRGVVDNLLQDCDAIHDVMESILHAVCSTFDDDIKHCVVSSILDEHKATTVTSDVINDGVIIGDLMREMLDNVESECAPLVPDDDIEFKEELSSFEQEKSKKAKKRKFLFDSIIDENMKRRSSRVKTWTKKKNEQTPHPRTPDPTTTSYKEKIIQILPEHLQRVPNLDAGEEKTQTTESKQENITSDGKFYADESDDVMSFIEAEDGNLLINLMKRFCRLLALKTDLKWREGTSEVLLKVFTRSQPHIILPCLDDVTNNESFRVDLFTLLCCVECQIDCNCRSKQLRDECGHNELESHLEYLSAAASDENIFRIKHLGGQSRSDASLNRDWKSFAVRFLWARSKYRNSLDQTQATLFDVELCRDVLNQVRTNPLSDEPYVIEPADFYVINLPNHRSHSAISLAAINERIKSLERAQVLVDTNKCFEQESYKQVILLLQPTIQKTTIRIPSTNHNRPRQIRQLLVSYQQLRDHSGVVTSSCYLLQEVIASTMDAARNKVKKKVPENEVSPKTKPGYDALKQWNATLHVLLQILEKTLNAKSESLADLTDDERTLMTQRMCDVMHYVFSRLDEGYSFSDTPLVWIILYKILKYEERQLDLLTSGLPDSFHMLHTAHEWMGERGLCCSLGGALLRFSVSEVKERFPRVEAPGVKEELKIFQEQCFACMFGFPVKNKMKKIQDHGVKQLPLTWADGVALIKYFQPEVLPEFDSFKASTVSLELTQLLLRIVQLTPNNVQLLIPNSEADVNAYIEGGCDVSMTLQPSPESRDLHFLGNAYYLLADYYFKNNEMNKGVKYYLHDIRINPDRFDSWAGLALSRSSQTDERLRLCESKKPQHKMKESGTERRGVAAMACFKRALSLSTNSEKLWIEYASLAYWMHSMYSRKQKRRRIFSVEDDKKRQEMLKISRMGFERVLECEGEEVLEEEWFLNYMLGKIAEKEGKPIQVYLRFYQTAAQQLHLRHAKYPKKIQAKYGSVNELSIEALEIHFRIHTSIMKYILRHPDASSDDVAYSKDLVEEMSNSPFALRRELKPSIVTSHDPEKIGQSSKLAVTSQSSDLTMGSLLPDNIMQALNIEESKTDEDTQSSAHSPMPASGEPSVVASDSREQSNLSVPGNQSAIQTSPSNKQGDVTLLSESLRKSAEERHKANCEAIIEGCENALRVCVRRFPQHYKAIYWLAHLYAHHEGREHLVWSRDLLYGSSSPWQQLRHMPAPGLLSDRNKTNLFNGVWRIPVDDIDRPGSFAAHLYRCVSLLIEVLRKLRHNEALLHIHNLLNRIPEYGKKYLREVDRVGLSRISLVYCRAVLHRKIKALRTSESSCPNLDRFTGVDNIRSLTDTEDAYKSIKMNSSTEECLNRLMDAYKVYQDSHKHPDSTTMLDNEADPDDATQQRLLADAFHKYTCLVARSNKPSSPNCQSLLDEALRFCQQQALCKKATAASSTTKVTSTTKLPSGSGFRPVSNSSLDGAHSTADEVKGLRIDDVAKPDSSKNCVGKKTNESEVSTSSVAEKATSGKVTIVERGGRTYTRIGPPSAMDNQRPFAPSPGSAFRPTKDEGKRPRLDPRLQHLKLQGNNDLGKKLIRSTSVPVSYPEGEENTPPHHRSLYRTGSFVSDSTKLKLKTAILSRTSAALVRKPSITDQEMMEIHGDADADSDSSQSEDDDDELPGVSNDRKRKFSDEASSLLVTPHQPAVITTAGST